MHKLTEQGVITLRKTAKWAATSPEHFNMGWVFRNFEEFVNERSHCGTTGCLAGWAAHFALAPQQRHQVLVLSARNAQSIREDWLIATIAMIHLSGSWDEELSILFNLFNSRERGILGITAQNVIAAIDAFINGGIKAACAVVETDITDRHPYLSEENFEYCAPFAKEILEINNAQVN